MRRILDAPRDEEGILRAAVSASAMKTVHVAALALALALGACKPSAKSESSQTTTTSGTASSTKSGLIELESKMVKGKAIGANASEKKIAAAITEIVGGDDGEKDWSAIVRVNETASPKKVVLLLRLDDLRGAKKGERKEILDLLASIVDEEIGPGADLAIGIKGKVFFGAVGTRSGEGALKKSTGSVVDTKPLDAAITAL
jgi:hypothetical protein